MAKIGGLTGLRGLAAILVAFDHYSLILLQAQPSSTIFYIATFSGSCAVGLFFLISGFVIPLSLLKTSSAPFLWRRLFRLYPVFVACCFLKFLALVVLAAHAGTDEVLGSRWLSMHSFKVFIINVSMFGGLRLPLDHMIEPIVWTLEIEVKFYILCATVFAIWRNNAQNLFRAFIALAAILAVAGYYISDEVDSPFLAASKCHRG